mmetsp:Transcript_35230/g.80203  ORF Transcript_35230/g.80203 Transcript_35230/m.80203 type:complete len:263 (-) Transcript_35230:1-789(-)
MVVLQCRGGGAFLKRGPPVRTRTLRGNSRGGGDDCEGEVGLHRDLAVDVRLALHLADAELLLEDLHLHLHHEDVARDEGLLPAHVVDAPEEEVLPLLGQRRLESNEPPELRHSLDLKHSRHDRVIREVSGELRLVGGDALDAHRALARDVLEDLVHEEEGIPVGDDLADVPVSSNRRRVRDGRRDRHGARADLVRDLGLGGVVRHAQPEGGDRRRATAGDRGGGALGEAHRGAERGERRDGRRRDRREGQSTNPHDPGGPSF